MGTASGFMVLPTLLGLGSAGGLPRRSRLG